MSAYDLEERFALMRPRPLGICRLVVGPDDAEDLVQETYIRAAGRIGQLRDPELFEAWVARIALNLARSHARRERRTLPQGGMKGGPARGSNSGLRELVDRLPTRERMVVVLHYAYGYQLNEVAALMGLSTINVRTIAFRARRRLRRQLEEAEHEPITELG